MTDILFLTGCSIVCYIVGYALVTRCENKWAAFCCAILFGTVFGMGVGEIVYNKPITQTEIEVNSE